TIFTSGVPLTAVTVTPCTSVLALKMELVALLLIRHWLTSATPVDVGVEVAAAAVAVAPVVVAVAVAPVVVAVVTAVAVRVAVATLTLVAVARRSTSFTCDGR